MPIKFKSGQIVFDRYKTVSWCDAACDCGHHLGEPTPCTFPSDVQQPPCVVIRNTDFVNCPACVTTVTDGGNLMELWFDGVSDYQTKDAPGEDTWRNSADIRLYAVIQFDSLNCRWTLSVKCKQGPSYYDVWTGIKSVGKTGVGDYAWVSGCDTTPIVTVN